jgi:predicted RNA methylase
MAPSVWILALKEFNKGKGEWCVPRKGSPEYDEIKKIMDKLKGKEEEKPKEIKKEEKKKKEEEQRPEEEKQEEPVKIELGNKNPKFSYEQIEEFKSQYDKDEQKTLREYLFEKKYSLERIFMLLDIGKQEIQLFNAFFTPIDVSKKLIEKSGIEDETKKNIDILEPTAGIGNIIMALLNKNYSNRKNYNIDCYEKLNNYYQIGKAIFTKNKNVNWFRDDFLKKDFNKKYDYIFTNPPFNLKNPYVNEKKPIKDIDFLNKSYKLLKDDGILCAIISNTYLSNKGDYKTFNDNLNSIKNIDKNNVLSYDVKGFNTVDETTVKDMKTNVNMTMLIIKKVPNINLI